MAPERPRTVPEGPGSAPEGSGMSRNDPRRSRKVLEVSGSTTNYPTPLALGGKPPRLPWPDKEVGAHQGEGILLQVGIPKPKYGRFPVGRCGKVWQVWESKLDSPPPLLRPKGLLATYIMRGGGGRAAHNLSPRPLRHPPSSNPRCSTIRPQFRRCSRSESVRVFSL